MSQGIATVKSFGRLNAWAMLRDLVNNNVVIFPNAGAPVDGTSGTGAGLFGPGSLVADYTNGQLYINTNTKASPTWAKLADAIGDLPLTDGDILVGNSSGLAQGRTMSGDATLTNAGVLSLSTALQGSADGLGNLRVARATWDFAVDGGAISAIDLGVTIPDNAVIVGGFVDVITTATSATDAGTGAISVASADDIVAAVAISDGANPWDAGLKAIIPKSNTPESTGIKLSSAAAVTFTIAVEAFTAGKFVCFLHYVVSD